MILIKENQINEMALPKEVFTGGNEPILKDEGKYEVYVKPYP